MGEHFGFVYHMWEETEYIWVMDCWCFQFPGWCEYITLVFRKCLERSMTRSMVCFFAAKRWIEKLLIMEKNIYIFHFCCLKMLQITDKALLIYSDHALDRLWLIPYSVVHKGLAWPCTSPAICRQWAYVSVYARLSVPLCLCLWQRPWVSGFLPVPHIWCSHLAEPEEPSVVTCKPQVRVFLCPSLSLHAATGLT